jgi:hypothetical protein
MTSLSGVRPLQRIALQHARFISLLILMLSGALILLPGAVFAEEASPPASEQKSPDAAGQKPKATDAAVQLPKIQVPEEKPKLSGAAELKQRSQEAFIQHRYAEAEFLNLKIIEKYPASHERQFAVQMLGTIFENNDVDVKKAIRWNREYLNKYADSRQAPFYKEKLEQLATVEKAVGQEEAFQIYHKIKFVDKGDDVSRVKKYEELLKNHPDFSLKTEVRKEIAYAYDRMNKPHESYAALQTLAAETPGHKLSGTDQIMAEADHSYWMMTTVWKWVALAVVAALFGVVLLVKPWRRLDRAWIRNYLIWTVAWVLLVASRMPTFYSMETGGFLFTITDTQIYTMAAFNLPVILWLMLFNRGEFWLTRPRTLRLISPLLTLVMTVASLYLFIAFQPNGPAIVSVFGVKYEYLLGELRNQGHL